MGKRTNEDRDWDKVHQAILSHQAALIRYASSILGQREGAKENRSRVSWIVEANEIDNPRDLQSGRKIFIPQETNERQGLNSRRQSPEPNSNLLSAKWILVGRAQRRHKRRSSEVREERCSNTSMKRGSNNAHCACLPFLRNK